MANLFDFLKLNNEIPLSAEEVARKEAELLKTFSTLPISDNNPRDYFSKSAIDSASILKKLPEPLPETGFQLVGGPQSADFELVGKPIGGNLAKISTSKNLPAVIETTGKTLDDVGSAFELVGKPIGGNLAKIPASKNLPAVIETTGKTLDDVGSAIKPSGVVSNLISKLGVGAKKAIGLVGEVPGAQYVADATKAAGRYGSKAVELASKIPGISAGARVAGSVGTILMIHDLLKELGLPSDGEEITNAVLHGMDNLIGGPTADYAPSAKPYSGSIPLPAFADSVMKSDSKVDTEIPKLTSETPSVETKSRKVASTVPVQPETVNTQALTPTKPFEDTEMEDALNQQKLTNTLATLGKISSKIGSAIAGTTVDNSNFDAISKLGSQGVQDIATKRKAKEELLDLQNKTALSDPTSEESKKRVTMAQAYLNSAGLSDIAKKIDGFSGSQIDKMFPTISQIVQGKENRDARKDTLLLTRELKNQEKQDRKNEKDEIRHQDWLERTLKAELNSDLVKKIERLKQDGENINRAIKNPGGIPDISVLYGFFKSIDENTGVKEGEIKLGLEAMNALDRIKAATSNFTSKKQILSDGMLKDIKTINTASQKAAQDSYNRRIKFVYNQGIDRGISKERIERSIGLLSQQPEEKLDKDAVEYTKRYPNVSYEQAIGILNSRKNKSGVK